MAQYGMEKQSLMPLHLNLFFYLYIMVCADEIMPISRASPRLHDWADLASFSPRAHTTVIRKRTWHYITWVLLCGFLVHRTVVKC